MDGVGTVSDVGATAGSVSGEAEMSTGLADDKLDSQSLTRSYLLWCSDDAGAGDAVITAAAAAMNVSTGPVGWYTVVGRLVSSTTNNEKQDKEKTKEEVQKKQRMTGAVCIV